MPERIPLAVRLTSERNMRINDRFAARARMRRVLGTEIAPRRHMEALTPETIALLITFLTLLGSQIGGMLIMLSRLNDRNKLIDGLGNKMNRRFDTIQSEMNRRFENVDKRFDTMNGEMNRRFDTMNQRFDETTLLIGELRDRTGKLEGRLEGFLADRRDRDAA